MGSILSGIFGGGESAGQAQQQQAMKASREDIQRLRPELMNAKLNLLRNASAAYQGSNNALETLWGDPNAKPQIGGPAPQRMFGHELPQEMPQGGQPHPQQRPQRKDPLVSGISSVMDPLNIFGMK